MRKQNYYTVILGGGLARRMGGTIKVLQELNGIPLVTLIRERLQQPDGQIALSVNHDDPRLEAIGLPLIHDETRDFSGPLAGIHAAMIWAEQQGGKPDDYLLSLAGDTPFFPSDLIARFEETVEQTQSPCLVARTERGPQPTFGLWRLDLKNALKESLLRRERKILSFAEVQGMSWVDFHDPSIETPSLLNPFFNINWPEDIEKAKLFLRG